MALGRDVLRAKSHCTTISRFDATEYHVLIIKMNTVPGGFFL